MTTERDIRNQIAYSREEGRAEGAEEKSIEIARRMLSDGLPFSSVALYTGLTESQLQGLVP